MLKTRRQALDAIIVKVKNRPGRGEYITYVSCLGSRPLTGERVRLERTTRKALEDAIDEFYRHNAEGGDAYASLTAKEALDARTAIDLLRGSGIKATLLDAAKTLLMANAASEPDIVPKTLSEAFDAYLAEHDGWSDTQKKSVRDRVWRFLAFAGLDEEVSSVTRASVERWLGRCDAPKTYNNSLRYISTFFRWCSEDGRHWCASSPTDGMKPKPEPYREPKFLSAEKFERLIRAAEDSGDTELVAVMVLGYMMGIRNAEIDRLAKGDGGAINVEDESVRITLPKGWTHGMVPRLVPMTGSVKEWFERWDIINAIRGASAMYAVKRAAKLALSLGIVVPHNAARHTFITMYVALTNDVTKAMTVAGTGRQHVARSYMGMASKREAEAFFQLRPSK